MDLRRPRVYQRSNVGLVFQGHPSNFKVTWYKTSPILTQIGHFRTVGRSQLSNPSDLPCVIPEVIFSCDQAALWMVFSVRLSVCLSVCPSVTPFWLCSHHRIIMKFSGVITLDQGKVHAKGQGQRSRSQRSRPKFSFPDCNSSLNSHMMIKLYI